MDNGESAGNPKRAFLILTYDGGVDLSGLKPGGVANFYGQAWTVSDITMRPERATLTLTRGYTGDAV